MNALLRDGTAPRGGIRITVNGTTYILIKATVKENASRETLKDEQGRTIVQDWVSDVPTVNCTAIFSANEDPLVHGDEFTHTFEEFGESITFIIETPQMEYSQSYKQQTFTAYGKVASLTS
jgi:hypothetical protein